MMEYYTLVSRNPLALDNHINIFQIHPISRFNETGPTESQMNLKSEKASCQTKGLIDLFLDEKCQKGFSS